MAKMITAEELAQIVTKLLITDEIDDSSNFAEFMTSVADLVCDHCGGEVLRQAVDIDGDWMIGIHANDSLPPEGGIWKDYDTDITFKDGVEL